MKSSKIKISVTKYSNGNILLGVNHGEYHVMTSDGIFVYTKEEMIEFGYLNK